MATALIITLCAIILIGFFLEIAVPRGGPTILPPPNRPPPGDEAAE